MDRLIYFKEMVARVECKGTTFDVYATADGSFDEKKSQFILELDCFANSEKSSDQEKLVLPLTLPSPETVRETMDRDEAIEAAKEIFESWVRRIRKSAPA